MRPSTGAVWSAWSVTTLPGQSDRCGARRCAYGASCPRFARTHVAPHHDYLQGWLISAVDENLAERGCKPTCWNGKGPLACLNIQNFLRASKLMKWSMQDQISKKFKTGDMHFCPGKRWVKVRLNFMAWPTPRVGHDISHISPHKPCHTAASPGGGDRTLTKRARALGQGTLTPQPPEGLKRL